MSRVFLLSANLTVEPYPVYPLGMAVLAGALTRHGHEVRQFDFLAAGGDTTLLQRELMDFAPDLVGLSLRNIDNVDSCSGDQGWYLERARDQVRFLRRVTAAPLVVGGPAFSIMPQAILEYLGADYGIAGEGEQALCTLVERLAAGEKPPALILPVLPGLRGADQAAPLFRPDLVAFYRNRSGVINLQTKRGCPFACAYCTYPALEGNLFRPREPRDVVDDMARIRRECGDVTLFLTDSIFNDPEGHYLALAEEMVRRGPGLRWAAFFRPAGLGRPELSLLKRAGLCALELGTDASSDTTLAALAKGFTFEEVVRCNQACLDEELPCAHFIIFGGPGETPATLREGLANVGQLGPSVVFAFSGIRILPGSPLHERACREGVIRASQSLLKPVYYYSPRIEVAAMNEAVTRAFRGFRQRIFPPSEGQVRMEVMRRFGFGGILWDRLIPSGREAGRSGGRPWPSL